jgi:leucyl aminopeptidase
MKRPRSNKIQSLFKSTELDPDKALLEIEKVIGYNSNSIQRVDDFGLFRMFKNTEYPARLITFDFSNGREKKVCLLGKGVLFDSGGYNLKSSHMEEMHSDRYGALVSVLLAQKLKLPVKIFLVVNLINKDAIVPGTILYTHYKNKPVEIVDTDAEGRIGLAQLIDSSAEYKHLISFATLTGHSEYSIGKGHSEVFSLDKKILSQTLIEKNKILGIGRIFDDYEKCLKSKIIQNYNNNYREAGAAKAYLFLTKFLNKHQTLTHFDIAGTMTELSKDYTYGLNEYENVINLIRKLK